MNASDLWMDYRNKVYGMELPEEQELECSRAFYAGMHTAFKGMIVLSESASDEELVFERMEDFRQSMLDAAKETLPEEWGP